MKKVKLILKELSKSRTEANAKIKIEVKGDDSRVRGDGNILGMLVAFSSLIKTIRRLMEKDGTNRETIEILLENYLKIEMEDIDE
nr:MAG TPA: hypothetical protein [Caudoviricetes sp.]